MDFSLTAAEQSFRDNLRSWLGANAPDWRGRTARFRDEDELDSLRDWQRRLYEAGYVGLSWPAAYGGQGATLVEQAIFNQELAASGAPPVLNVIGLNMAGPTIIIHGSDAQKHQWLKGILTAEEIWCQGFSEPGAGSDLANVRTSAVRDGDDWVVNGQKVWTSFAHAADWCILVTRTSSEGEKHHGLTYMVMDMHAPGVEVRPLRQITGTAEFNELFLTDVRIPVANTLDAVGRGWQVAMTTLMHERATLSFELLVRSRQTLDRIVELARELPHNGGTAAQDPITRQRLAKFQIEAEALKLNSWRGLSNIMKTGVPGPEGSTNKLFWSELQQRMLEFAMEMMGPYGQLTDDEWAIDGGALQYHYLRSKGNTIEAGTSEVLRNIIAERVLGLPRSR